MVLSQLLVSVAPAFASTVAALTSLFDIWGVFHGWTVRILSPADPDDHGAAWIWFDHVRCFMCVRGSNSHFPVCVDAQLHFQEFAHVFNTRMAVLHDQWVDLQIASDEREEENDSDW